MGIENIRYCRKCKKAFDQGTNYDICPKCRILQGVEVNGYKRKIHK